MGTKPHNRAIVDLQVFQIYFQLIVGSGVIQPSEKSLRDFIGGPFAGFILNSDTLLGGT